MSTETIFRNGHAFQNFPESAMIGYALDGTRTVTPYIACRSCGTRADTESAHRQCLGIYADFWHGPECVGITVEVKPKGRKAIEERVLLRPEGIVELARYLGAPGVERGKNGHDGGFGHAFWHWNRPEATYPCAQCPSPLGDVARRLEAAQRDAIDADIAPAKLPEPQSAAVSEEDADDVVSEEE